jgi:cysteine desulfurase/selenocysteine lyase
MTLDVALWSKYTLLLWPSDMANGGDGWNSLKRFVFLGSPLAGGLIPLDGTPLMRRAYTAHTHQRPFRMDVGKLRRDFPLLDPESGKAPPVYLDNACQTFRPRQVMEAMADYYESFPACAGRSVHRLATEVSLRYDEARMRAADFFGAESPSEIAFVKNSTEALNTVISGYEWSQGDEIVTTDYEHNSVSVPVLRAVDSQGIKHRIIRSTDDSQLDLDALSAAMSKKVKLVAMCLTSNVTGYTLPPREVVEIAHDHGARVLFDAAQAAPSMSIDVKDLGVDFMAASAHKMLGPSGVGLFYARSDAAESIRPVIAGGHSVSDATSDTYSLLPPPDRFEAGLQNYSGIIGTRAALDYLSYVGLEEIASHEIALNKRATRGLADIEGISIIGPGDPNLRKGILSFNLKGLSAHDVAMIMDNSRNIQLRSGMHCCHPFFHRLRLEGCARASAYLYNTPEEIDFFVESIEELKKSFT